MLRGTVLSLLCGALLAGLTGCGRGGSGTTPVGLALQREDLIAATRALSRAGAQVDHEVAATKAAWLLVANGLHVSRGAPVNPAIAAAAQAAGALKLPVLFEESRARTLTGPASGLVGEFRRFQLLALRGWQLIEYSAKKIATGTPAAARFARATVALYIDSVYDAHFGLAEIGKELLAGYKHLGAATGFGSRLSEGEVMQIAAAYSVQRDRLQPHAGVKLGS